MNIIFELYHNLADISRTFLHFLIAFSASLIITSFICFIFADSSGYYYDIRLFSIELIATLRSIYFIISAGILITHYIEKTQEQLK